MADFHKEDFARILAERNVILTDLQTRQFALYCDMLREWNERMNLTAICEEDAIYEKHFLDCVLPMLEYQPKGSLCDVGAGAGFPSLPMKIMDPTLQVTIIEPIQKRITFCVHCVRRVSWMSPWFMDAVRNMRSIIGRALTS